MTMRLALQMLGWKAGYTSAAEALRLPGFAETVRGVVTSVWQAIDEHRPDSLTVEFGIEITARTGAVLSVLAEGGGTAQVKVTAPGTVVTLLLFRPRERKGGPYECRGRRRGEEAAGFLLGAAL